MAEHEFRHRINVLITADLRRSTRGRTKFKVPSAVFISAAQSAAQDVSERGVFNRYDDLTAGSPYRGENFDKIEGAIIVNVLNWVVHH